ncbi:MAG: carboxypeptidase M32 [Armatimonadota bacterium]
MSAFEQLLNRYRDLCALEASVGLMNWDRQVIMPVGGGPARTEHVRRLSKMRHELLTSNEMAKYMDGASRWASEEEQAQITVLKREIDHAQRMPLELIERKSRVSSDAYDVWRKCRQEADYPPLAPYYSELFLIARETAEALGYQDHPYDALIDQYEEGSTHAEAIETLGALKEPAINLVREIQEEGRHIDSSFLERKWDQERLKSVMERVIGQIGFNLDAGRLDISTNAFCTNQGVGDVRMTTRPSNHIRGIVSSTLHEMGHALYEQNQRSDWEGTPLIGGVSLAVHESQSRTWENVVGRSLPFWSFFFPWFQEEFSFLGDHSTEEFYAAYSKVEPGFIRVGSDEVTYNLHILIRFELEVALMMGELDAKDLPEAWDNKYDEYLGVFPLDDSVGCLQDVHWARGSVGYFPTYSYGNLIGVQIWNKLKSEVDGVDEMISRGNFRPIMDWLVEKVYGYGRLMPPKFLVEHVTGSKMQAQPWLDYADSKFRAIHGLD